MKQQNNFRDVYTIVTDRIIEALENGVAPWRQKWNSYGLPRNYTSRKHYQGLNAFLLNLVCVVRRYEYPIFMTMRQANELGGRIRQGAKSIPVIYWNICFYDKDGRIIPAHQMGVTPIESRKAFLKYYTVFNMSDVEGVQLELPQLGNLSEADKIGHCEQVIQGMPNAPKVEFSGDGQAWYSRMLDTVHMPKFEAFHNAEFYYSTFFHELAHSTGHATRLNRDEIVTPHKFGTPEYSKEELVAELCAAMLCGVCAIENVTIDNNSAYIKSWLEVLKNDRRLIVDAAAKAQKAADFILGKSGSGSTPAQEPAAAPAEVIEDLPF